MHIPSKSNGHAIHKGGGGGALGFDALMLLI